MIPSIEKASKAEIKAFQEEKLKDMLQYLYEKSPLLQNAFSKKNSIQVF